MVKRKNILSLFGIMSFVILVLNTSSCKKEEEATGIDLDLFTMSESTQGFVWYKNSDAYLTKSSGSGHNYPFFRTRFNAIAAQVLDNAGNLNDTTLFPENSLIVKELVDDNKSLKRYAILYKKSDHKNADAKGWVWGYVNADKSVSVSASGQGAQCITCHSQSGSIDYVLMKKFFP